MQFPVKTGAPSDQSTACAIVPIFEERRLSGIAKELDDAAGGVIRELLGVTDTTNKLGGTLLAPAGKKSAARKLLLVGCGKRNAFGAKQLASATAAATNALRGSAFTEVVSYLSYTPPANMDPYYAARTTVETVCSSSYRFDELKSRADAKSKLGRFAIAINGRAQLGETRRGIAHGAGIATGVALARDLGNRPPNVCTPSHLGQMARDLARRYPNLSAKVLGEAEMKRLGMGALLSVTRGATEPARLIVLEYKGGRRGTPPVALCGKGITFDTGGISLKPPAKMDEMKFDMCGAASVLGTFAALGEIRAKVNVVGIIPACENMPGSQATRPGDIVKSMSGQTVEILNTDAEGRLILCDALTYAQQFEPRCLIDIATLTGACVVALGHVYTGLFSNDETLLGSLTGAGDRSLDPVWRLPVSEEYGETLKSNFADFANAGSRDGGASIAANFLSRFVDPYPWAHLDIAGVAWRSDAAKGATGRPVPLLTDFLLHLPAAE